MPCVSPKMNVSCSKPGTTQKMTSAAKIASSTHEARLTQTKSGPGTGFRRAVEALRPDLVPLSIGPGDICREYGSNDPPADTGPQRYPPAARRGRDRPQAGARAAP